MTRIRLAYVHEFIDRHGKPRRYFRRPGFKLVRLPGAPGSHEFMQAYQSALEGGVHLEIGVARSTPGTVSALIGAYLSSIAFKSLAAQTQRSRRGILERFRHEHVVNVLRCCNVSTYKRCSMRKPIHRPLRATF
jgi:hypothetical protein